MFILASAVATVFVYISFVSATFFLASSIVSACWLQPAESFLKVFLVFSL
ncbi:hypothetical protein YC2023_106677 [Brassica napus]